MATVIDVTPADDPRAVPAAPVLALPLRLAGPSLVTLPQGSAAELRQSVGLLLRTRPGERVVTPAYGTPNPLGLLAVNGEDVRAAITTWEPRVDVDITVAGDGEDVAITVTVREDT